MDNVYFATGGSFQSIQNNFQQASFDANGNLSWNFWIGTAGWVTFSHNASEQAAKIVCPNNILDQKVANSSQGLCYLTGAAWSESSGWILLNKDNIKTGSGVYYNPNSSNLEWFGWSESLGWIPMFTGKIFKNHCDENLSDPNCKDKILPDDWYKKPDSADSTIAINFIGRVAVLGNIAGTKIFEITNQSQYNNQNPGYNYQTVQHIPIINAIRGSVAQLTRNLDKNNYKIHPFNNFIYNESSDYCINSNPLSSANCNSNGEKVQDLNGIDTIIIKWHDVIIDSNFNVPSTSSASQHKMKAIIALSNENGKWWNIYITKNVKQVYGYLVAEGSIFSGEKQVGWTQKIYLDDGKVGTSGLPLDQLYINGVVVSKNTIGWVSGNSDIASKCPVLVTDCNDAKNARKYDWSFFRNYIPNKDAKYSSLPNSITDIRVKNASVVIEYNPGIINNPPVGLEEFR